MPGLASTATATPISQTYFFGDSDSDTGNLFLRTAGFVNGPPNYWEGRSSNGPVWPEYFAGDLGTDSTASQLGGTNYATGASWTTGPNPNPNLDPFFHTLAGQVSDYLTNGAPPAPDALYSISIGSGDPLPALAGATDPAPGVAEIEVAIGALYDAGARRFVVSTLRTTGSFPLYKEAFNVLLTAQLPGLEASLAGSQIHLFDRAELLLQLLADPVAFGFTSSGTCVPDQNDPVTYPGDPACIAEVQTDIALGRPVGDTYYSHDVDHTTTAVHRLVADGVLDAIPEPSAGMLLVFGAAWLAGLSMLKGGT